jgi:hypothetical protein
VLEIMLVLNQKKSSQKYFRRQKATILVFAESLTVENAMKRGVGNEFFEENL